MRDRVYRFLIVLFLGMAVVFCILAYHEHKPFLDAKISHEAIKKTAVVPESNEDASDPMNRRIDFELLKEVNPDIIGWLYIPQIGVDEPILHGRTDTEYLNKGFDGKRSVLGSVFTFAHVNENLSDPHICLFGHNMMSGQMKTKYKAFISIRQSEPRDLQSCLYIPVTKRMRYSRMIGNQIKRMYRPLL